MRLPKEIEIKFDLVQNNFQQFLYFVNAISKKPQYSEYFHEIFPDFKSAQEELIRQLKYITDAVGVKNEQDKNEQINLFCQQFAIKFQNTLLRVNKTLNEWLENKKMGENKLRSFMIHLIELHEQNQLDLDSDFSVLYSKLVQQKLTPEKLIKDIELDLTGAIKKNISFYKLCIKLYDLVKKLCEQSQNKSKAINTANAKDKYDHLTNITDELKLYICLFLPLEDLGRLGHLNKTWRKFSKEPCFWANHLSEEEKNQVAKQQYKQKLIQKFVLREIEKTLAIQYISKNNQNEGLVPGVEKFNTTFVFLERGKGLKAGEYYLKVNDVAPRKFTLFELKTFAKNEVFSLGLSDKEDIQSTKLNIFYLECLLNSKVEEVKEILNNPKTNLVYIAKEIGILWNKHNYAKDHLPQLIQIYATLVKQAEKEIILNPETSLIAHIQYAELDHNDLIVQLPENKQGSFQTEEYQTRRNYCEALFKIYKKQNATFQDLDLSDDSKGIDYFLANQADESLQRLSVSMVGYKPKQAAAHLRKMIDSELNTRQSKEKLYIEM